MDEPKGLGERIEQEENQDIFFPLDAAKYIENAVQSSPRYTYPIFPPQCA
jgi:hypothetical protein